MFLWFSIASLFVQQKMEADFNG
uniref:Uncharacterized protein n=1 Tax=Anguilla anguilla TaxID=7936 RepID=A0A0E9S6R8_ANGAN